MTVLVHRFLGYKNGVMAVQLAQMVHSRTLKKQVFFALMEAIGIHLMVTFSLSGIQECFSSMERGYA